MQRNQEGGISPSGSSLFPEKNGLTAGMQHAGKAAGWWEAALETAVY